MAKKKLVEDVHRKTPAEFSQAKEKHTLTRTKQSWSHSFSKQHTAQSIKKVFLRNIFSNIKRLGDQVRVWVLRAQKVCVCVGWGMAKNPVWSIQR